MKNVICCIGVVLGMLATGMGAAAADSAEKNGSPSGKMMLIVLAGQSNMSGRGFIEPEDRIPIPNVYTLNKDGVWIPSVEPTHFDRPKCGTCLGRTFAKMLHEKYPDRKIGIVPCAVGGSPLGTWLPGVAFTRPGTQEHPYDDALARIRLAQKDGEIAVMLWHQGCSNPQGNKTLEAAQQSYQRLLLRVIRQFRQDVPELGKVPFILGHLRSFRETMKIDHVNAAIDEIVKTEPLTFAVSAEGVEPNPDKLHYNRASLQMLGERYFEVFSGWQKESSRQ